MLRRFLRLLGRGPARQDGHVRDVAGALQQGHTVLQRVQANDVRPGTVDERQEYLIGEYAKIPDLDFVNLHFAAGKDGLGDERERIAALLGSKEEDDEKAAEETPANKAAVAPPPTMTPATIAICTRIRIGAQSTRCSCVCATPA